MDKIIDVAVIMGSDSDLPTMAECLKIFDKFGISYSVNVGSAHRTPEHVKKCVQKSIATGAKVFIAVAGMSAALPGVVASETTFPVIGVPMDGKYLASMDALFSVSQMPPFMPVACVSIGKAGAINSAILAIQILAINDAKLADKFKVYRQDMAKSIVAKDEKLNKTGYVKYIEEMKK
ncbi:MAG: 5-(carboxyamino)imidazole ribonucleotide mutase [Endomicrobiaceae bacterium]|nr:5-(carboxyamino)imidazole ribonucleotide mutase [Endomicrobiaceae bacterium]